MISLTAYAKHRGVSKEAVSRAIKKGRLARCVERNDRGQPKIRSAEEADAEWAETTRPQPVAPVDHPDGVKFIYADEAAREKHWKASLAQLEYETKSGDMVPAVEARDVVVERFSEVKTKLIGLPHRCKQRIPTLTLGEIEIIEDLVAEALEALADEGEEDGE